MVSLIVVDSNVWIFLNMDNYPAHASAVKKVSELQNEGLVTNIIILSEVFHKLGLLLSKKEAYSRVMKILESKDVLYLPMEEDIMKKALHLSAQTGIRINDALIAAQSRTLRYVVLTDNVKDFKKVKGLKIIPLR